MAKKKSPPKITNAIDLFSKSYEIVMRNLTTFGILLLLPLIASIVSTLHYKVNTGGGDRWAHINIFSGTMPAYSIVGVVGLGIFIFIVASVIALVIQAMLTGLEIEGAKGKTPDINQLWLIGKKFWLRLFGLTIMILLYVALAAAAGLVILLPFILLHKLGIGLFLAFVWMIIALANIIQRYFLAPYVLVDQDKSILDAMMESAAISKNHIWDIWSVILVSVVLGFTGVVPVIGPVISFILGSLYIVAPALRYLELKKTT